MARRKKRDNPTDIDPTTVPRREPVIPDEAFDHGRVHREWNRVAQAIRRELQNGNERVQTALLKVVGTPVSEILPRKVMEDLLEDDRIRALCHRYRDSLTSYLALESVPDKNLSPDIQGARARRTPEEMARLVEHYNDPTAEFQLRIESGHFFEGVSGEERQLARHRYIFARDIKMLALAAELQDHPTVLDADTEQEVKLPSGVKIFLDPKKTSYKDVLLHPEKWVQRKQIKDRVHEVTVEVPQESGGTEEKHFILKERKTNRHYHTTKGGHIDGLSSREEYETARFFFEHGNREYPHLKIRWEEPIGYVEYPDGFSFTLYEMDETLVKGDSRSTVNIMTERIHEHRDDFEEEYERIADAAENWLQDDRVTRFRYESRKPSLNDYVQSVIRILRRQKKVDEDPRLTFDEFAFIKAEMLTKNPFIHLNELLAEEGYENSDLDGYLSRMADDGSPCQEVVGFDFEYFTKSSNPDQLLHEYNWLIKECDEEVYSRGMWFDGEKQRHTIRPIQRAGYMALLAEKKAQKMRLRNERFPESAKEDEEGEQDPAQ